MFRKISGILCLFVAVIMGCSSGSSSSSQPMDVGDVQAEEDALDVVDSGPPIPSGPVGVGTECESHGDCASAGLQCMSMGKGSNTTLCSIGCETDGDCPQGHCGMTELGISMCLPADFCSACSTDNDCGLGGAPTCMPDPSGTGFCTAECNPTDPACPGGYKCNQIGDQGTKFYCQRLGETCWGDGKQCSPCGAQGDCETGHKCYGPSAKGEQFCAAECSSSDDCRRDFDCALELGLCMRVVGDRLVDTCLEDTGGFCDSCVDAFECQSGLCYTHQESGVKHCSMPCEGQKDDETCPYGTFCVLSNDSETGWACTPPQLYKCSGWLACIGVECPIGQSCEDGWCVSP